MKKIVKNWPGPILLFLFIQGVTTSCSDFLDKKASSALAIPETVKDLRAMLDYESAINNYFPSLVEMGADDYYVPSATLLSRPQSEQMIYTWQRHELRIDVPSWNQPYNTIMICNIVLESLERGAEGRDDEKDMLKGEALFVRGYAYYYLSQIYCRPFDEQESRMDLGLPLRISSDFNETYTRSSVLETYDLIIRDLEQAILLLPETSPYKTRPTKAAAYGALARVYLVMGRYEEANAMAGRALDRYDVLMDYNDLDASKNFPIDVFHKELIYHASTTNGLLLAASRARVPHDLFQSYEDNDLRKAVFFNSRVVTNIEFKGFYSGKASSYFAGIATDELYLIRAECEIRSGSLPDGLSLLNTLVKTRWKHGTYIPYETANREQALSWVLAERRKQLLRRGLRWSDLRRLNKDPRFEETLVRTVQNGTDITIYTLEPGAVQYVYPIPFQVMEFNSFDQNPI